MKRKRHHETQVWRDPLVKPNGRSRNARNKDAAGSATNGAVADEQLTADSDTAKKRQRRKVEPTRRKGVRIIAGPAEPPDPREIERSRLLARLLAAEGRPMISATADDLFAAGFELPEAQNVCLQLLEHRDEHQVRRAIAKLGEILLLEPAERKAVLRSRLRRFREFADEDATQQAAADLLRQISSSGDGLTPTPAAANVTAAPPVDDTP